MRLFGIIAAILILFGVLTSCLHIGAVDSVFGIDVRSAEVVSDTDSHGGFLGDGERVAVLKFSDESVEKEIEASPDWLPLPASDGVAAVIWGVEYENESGVYGVGPFTLAEIPKVENGWYCYCDRSPEGYALSGDPYAYPDFTPPLNFTFAVYDADEDILYYVESDS